MHPVDAHGCADLLAVADRAMYRDKVAAPDTLDATLGSLLGPDEGGHP